MKIYSGLGLALVDLIRGTIRQFPHKKHLLYLSAQIPIIDQVVSLMASEGCTLQPLSLADLESADASRILPDTNLVVFAEDDPLLGQIFETEKFEKLLNEKKIMGLRISHHHHRYLPANSMPSRYVAQIKYFANDLSLVAHHDRWRWSTLLSEVQTFGSDLEPRLKNCAKQGFIHPAGIVKFESLKSAEWQPVFAKREADRRVWDRAVISWRDLNAQAVCELLQRKLQERFQGDRGLVDHSHLIETTSLSRWGGLRTMDWLKNYGFDDEMIRGTLILDQSLANAEVASWLVEIRKQILSLQTGT